MTEKIKNNSMIINEIHGKNKKYEETIKKING